MKTSLLATALALAAITPAFAQKAGDTVTAEALGKLQWVQGEAPAEWESGKLYVLECWATWCGPCIAAIPHVDHLYDTFYEKGLRVIGVNVWEDGLDKVSLFVKKKGDGMSYPVAYTGRGGAFETEWLKPAGVRGIPHAFVVRDGKVLFTAHPSQLTDAIVSDLLEGGEKSEAAIRSIQDEAVRREKTAKAFTKFRQAAPKNDAAAMEEALVELRELKAQESQLSSLELEFAVRTGKFEEATKKLQELPENPFRSMTLASTLRLATSLPDTPASFTSAIADAVLAGDASYLGPNEFQTLSRALWNLDRKPEAVKAAENAELKAAEYASKNPNVVIPTAAYARWTQSLKEEKFPTVQEFATWYKEESDKLRQSKAATPPVEKP